MANENYVPTQAEVWDFLVGFKEATEAGFKRLEVRFDAFELRVSHVESQVTNLETEFQFMRSDLVRIERRLVRIDDRLAAIEDLNIHSRLDDHGKRITRLEPES